MIELEFDRITSNKPVNLFLINTAWLSCIVLLLSMLYTVDKTLLPISVLFCMIALEFDQIQSYHPPNLFLVNPTRLSWIVLLSLISYTANETLFSIIVVLFWMIALEFDRIMSNKLGNLFWINATWLSWIVLFSITLYAPIGRLFSINVLFWMLALELNSIQSKQFPNLFRVNATWLRQIVLFITIPKNEKMFSVSLIFWMIESDDDKNKSSSILFSWNSGLYISSLLSLEIYKKPRLAWLFANVTLSI